MLLLLFFAFLAGIATVLSPCILPILPAVLSGGIDTGKLRPLGIISGLILSFSFFTLTLTALVHVTGIQPDVLRYIAIAAIGIFGTTMIFPQLGVLFERATAFASTAGNQLQTKTVSRNTGFWGGFILGLSLGLLWTPCAGPILAAVTTLALTSTVNATAILLTITYSIGASIPLLLVTYGGNRALTSSKFLASKSEGIRKAFGVIMILTAIAMVFNVDRQLQIIAVQYLPNFQPDNSAAVTRALQHLKGSNSSLSGQIVGKPVDTVKMNDQAGISLADMGEAPELQGITGWINSEPQTLAALRGKVVLIDFWTYTCINCVRTLPYVTAWYNQYKDRGFVVIGVHTPEFEFEKNHDNVAAAVVQDKILYPVAQDNTYATWNAYQNQYWPAHYLIDRQGHIRQVHFGEGNYAETENAIRSLLGENPILTSDSTAPHAQSTPETYLGSARGNSSDFTLSGAWTTNAESVTSQSDQSQLVIHFQATKVHLVLAGKSSTPLTIRLDGKFYGTQIVDQDRMYTLVDLGTKFESHTLSLQVPKGIQAFAFTFSP